MTSRPYQQQPARPAYGGRDTGPSYAQVLEEIRNAGMIETTSEVVVSPSAENDNLIIIRATCVMPSLLEGHPLRRFSAIGAAYPRKTGNGIIHGVSNPSFYMHVAESRAKKRAWMDALGRGDGLEENVRAEVFAERARNQTVSVGPALPVPSAVSNPDEIVSEQIAERLVTAVGLSIEDARTKTRGEAAEMLRRLRDVR